MAFEIFWWYLVAIFLCVLCFVVAVICDILLFGHIDLPVDIITALFIGTIGRIFIVQSGISKKE